MAFFLSGPDTQLPVLTQLMQTNLDDKYHVLRFWRRAVLLGVMRPSSDSDGITNSAFAALSGGIADAENDRLFSSLIEVAFRWEVVSQAAQAEGKADGQEFLLERFQAVCKSSAKIITQLYETSEVPLSVLNELRAAVQDKKLPQLMPVGVLVPAPIESDSSKYRTDETGEIFVSLSQFIRAWELRDFVPIFLVSDAVEALFVDIRTGKTQIEKCPECENLFLSSHGKREFCSLRCGGRNRQRKYRQQARHEKGNVTNKIGNDMVK